MKIFLSNKINKTEYTIQQGGFGNEALCIGKIERMEGHPLFRYIILTELKSIWNNSC